MGGIVGGDIKKDVSMVSEGASSMRELMIDEERLKEHAEYATRNLVREVLHHVKRYLVGYIYGCYNLLMLRYGFPINYEVKTSSIPWGFEVTVKVTIPEKARDDLRSSILEKLKGKGSSPSERAVLRLRSYMERLREV
jgi:hypothetical protein